MTATKTRLLTALLGLLILSAPAFAQGYGRRYAAEREGEFRLRVGDFRPDGNSPYWHGVEQDFTGSISDFEDASFGLDYLLPLGDRLSLMFSGSVYQGSATNAYRNFVDNFGDRIRHDTTLNIGSGTVGLLLYLTGANAPVQPYVAAGGGAYPWRLKESGDFIDFGPPSQPIFHANLKSSGVAFGYYGLAGFAVPITRRTSIFAEGRWTRVDDTLKDDFEGFGKIDLSGREFAAGFSWSL
jgi:hypothetical protein